MVWFERILLIAVGVALGFLILVVVTLLGTFPKKDKKR